MYPTKEVIRLLPLLGTNYAIIASFKSTYLKSYHMRNEYSIEITLDLRDTTPNCNRLKKYIYQNKNTIILLEGTVRLQEI